MNKLLKLFGLIECFMCNKKVFIWNSEVVYFTDNPEDTLGHKERICKDCCYTFEKKARE